MKSYKFPKKTTTKRVKNQVCEECDFFLRDCVCEKVKWEEFVRALDNNDFSVGDSFWLKGVEFEVKTIR